MKPAAKNPVDPEEQNKIEAEASTAFTAWRLKCQETRKSEPRHVVPPIWAELSASTRNIWRKVTEMKRKKS